MSDRFLDKILASKRKKVERQKRETDLEAVKERAFFVRRQAMLHGLRTSLTRKDRTNIVAEIKRASPSKGTISENIDVSQLARHYRDGGAAAISVLTEEDFFSGSLDDLIAARQVVDLPILRKDFVIDEFQIYESAAAGADAVLLIAAALDAADLKEFLRCGREKLGMDVIVEVHTSDEFGAAANAGADIIGVNNRDLHSFEVSLDTSRKLIRLRNPNTIMISESGLSTREEINELKSLGFDGFLIGESLMRSRNPAEILGGLISI